jgi:hypothetical protein
VVAAAAAGAVVLLVVVTGHGCPVGRPGPPAVRTKATVPRPEPDGDRVGAFLKEFETELGHPEFVERLWRACDGVPPRRGPSSPPLGEMPPRDGGPGSVLATLGRRSPAFDEWLQANYAAAPPAAERHVVGPWTATATGQSVGVRRIEDVCGLDLGRPKDVLAAARRLEILRRAWAPLRAALSIDPRPRIPVLSPRPVELRALDRAVPELPFFTTATFDVAVDVAETVLEFRPADGVARAKTDSRQVRVLLDRYDALLDAFGPPLRGLSGIHPPSR